MKVLEFIFSSFWTFVGTFILLGMFMKFIIDICEVLGTEAYHRLLIEKHKELNDLQANQTKDEKTN